MKASHEFRPLQSSLVGDRMHGSYDHEFPEDAPVPEESSGNVGLRAISEVDEHSPRYTESGCRPPGELGFRYLSRHDGV